MGKRTGQARKPARIGNRAGIALGDCAAVPVAARNVSGNWGAGDCLRRAGGCALLSRAERSGNLAAGRRKKRLNTGNAESTKKKNKRNDWGATNRAEFAAHLDARGSIGRRLAGADGVRTGFDAEGFSGLARGTKRK